MLSDKLLRAIEITKIQYHSFSKVYLVSFYTSTCYRFALIGDYGKKFHFSAFAVEAQPQYKMISLCEKFKVG